MTIDVATFVGSYPFRAIGLSSPESLLSQMDRLGVDEAWVGGLDVFLHKDPSLANDALRRKLDSTDRLRYVPTVDAGLPDWELDVDQAKRDGAVAIRIYPTHQGLPPDGSVIGDLVVKAGEVGLPVVLTVRFEDIRQRHPLDVAADLPAAAVRFMARRSPYSRLVVTHASREYIEEVYFGLTPEEASRILFDISCLWGPPSDDLNVLVETVGVERFVYGSGFPLRIPDAPVAKLDLADLRPEDRVKIESGNVRQLSDRST